MATRRQTANTDTLPVSQGITAEMQGNTLVLRLNTAQDLGPSKSGKTHVVATTRGFVTLPNGQRVSLNLIREPNEE